MLDGLPDGLGQEIDGGGVGLCGRLEDGRWKIAHQVPQRSVLRARLIDDAETEERRDGECQRSVFSRRKN
jgi:hypothetical protein